MPDPGLYRRAVAFGVAFLAVVIAVTLLRDGGTAAGSDGASSRRERIPASTPSTSTSPDDRERIDSDAEGVPVGAAQAVNGLLTQRGAAITGASKAGWLAALDPAAQRFRTDQGRIFGRITALKPVAWSYAFATATALPAKQATKAPGGWTAEVDLKYQLTKDGPTVVRRQYLTMVPARQAVRGQSVSTGQTSLGDWRIAGDSAGPTQIDLWDISPITVTRAARCVVVSATKYRSLGRRITGLCGAAAKRVDAVWGKDWSPQTTLILPESQTQLGTLLERTGDDDGGLDDTAAVTVGPATSPAEQVLVNPSWFGEFDALGIRIILTHEFVHVATRDTGSLYAPIWLEEGFADYVGYDDSGLTPRDIATEALHRVDQGKVPSALPADDDFSASGDTVSAAYGFSWAAVRTMAQHGGTKRVVQFYKAAAASDTGSETSRVNRAVQDVLGLRNTKVFTAEWQDELRALAG